MGLRLNFVACRYLIQLNKALKIDINRQENSSSLRPKLWQTAGYGSLLNHQALSKSLKRSLWGCELKSMLNSFMEDMGELQDNLKFRVSGKILNSSTYVLKSKTNTIILDSLETQDDIKGAQMGESPNNLNTEDIIEGALMEECEVVEGEFDEMTDYLDDDAELYEAFTELNAKDMLNNQQWTSFQEEKVNHVLNMDAQSLNNKISSGILLLNAPRKVSFKKIALKDLARTLNGVLKVRLNSDELQGNKKHKQKKELDPASLPFLPDNFIANAKKKRADFESRIESFQERLVCLYQDEEPIAFLSLIDEPTPKALVDCVLIVLHLLNHEKIELWESYIKGELPQEDNTSKNDGMNVFLTPKL